MKSLRFSFLLAAGILVAPVSRAESAPVVVSTETAPVLVTVGDSDAALAADAGAYFTDATCRKLKPGVTAATLPAFRSALLRGVAAALLDGTYDAKYRGAEFEANLSAKTLGERLKLGNNFSHYEGITGIYLEPGEHVVFVGDTGGRPVQLRVPDLMRQPTPGFKPTEDPKGWGLHKEEFELKPGLNRFTVKTGGNAYVCYYDDAPDAAPKVPVHFPTGKVNGYFDAATMTNADWDRLLDNAVSPIMDARGKHIQVAYPVKWFDVYTRGKGLELINNYDKMLHHHYELCGLVKYDLVPKNRILSRVNHNYYMFRDGDGVAYLGDKGTMGMVADPARVIKGDPCWGFSHEAGHALQIPQITWGGMTEVSVNLFSLYTGGKLGNVSRLKEQNSYAKARKAIVEAEERRSYLENPDVFNRLVPFWQLHLHFTKNGHPDFYADVFEAMRRTPEAGKGNEAIRNQFQFIRIVTDLTKTDLTDFFDKWGFFRTGKFSVGDYGNYDYDVSPELVAETKAYIASKNYPKPATDLTLIAE